MLQCVLIEILVLAFFFSTASVSAQAQQQSPAGSRLRPAMLVWSVGIDGTGNPSRLVETITRSSWEGDDTWRVTHYPQDPSISTVNEYDLYDLARTSLAPLRSASNRGGNYLELRVSKAVVVIRSSADQSEHIDLGTEVRPEGPGLTAFVATLPLKSGYEINYQVVDRWSGHGNGRIKKMRLAVESRGVIKTAMAEQDCYEVSIRAEDGSFEIREFVIAEGLHWPLRMTYIRGAAKAVSEVVAIAVSAQ